MPSLSKCLTLLAEKKVRGWERANQREMEPTHPMQTCLLQFSRCEVIIQILKLLEELLKSSQTYCPEQ